RRLGSNRSERLFPAGCPRSRQEMDVSTGGHGVSAHDAGSVRLHSRRHDGACRYPSVNPARPLTLAPCGAARCASTARPAVGAASGGSGVPHGATSARLRKRGGAMRTPQQIEEMVPVSDRSAQRFPRLRPAQLDVVRRFAEAHERNFAPGECMFNVGERAVPTWFLTSGSTKISGRDGLNQEIDLRTLESGHFTGELHQLADGPAVAGPGGCAAIRLDAVRLRALIVGSAELGELIMRAFILRRVGLHERGVGPILLGRAGSPDLLRLQTFLRRNAYPHLVLDCSS